MDNSQGQATLTLDQVVSLREKTDAISHILGSQLRAYIDTLKPLLSPRRLLGRHVGSRDDVNGSDLALSRLKELYREGSHTPFGLPLEFPEHTLAQLDSQPAIYRWEYTHAAKSERDSKNVTITSPVQWVLSYESTLSLSEVQAMLESRIERKTESLRQFLLNALVMHLVVKNQPNLIQLMAGLHYRVSLKSLPGLGALSFVTISAPLTSFRPADDLLLMAMRFSGIPAFVELISLESVETFEDPLRGQLLQALT